MPPEDQPVSDDDAARRVGEQIAKEIGRDAHSQPRIGVYDVRPR
jgi:hypothetical protein